MSAVNEALIGIAAINQDLSVFDYGNVLVRKDYLKTTVRLLSGGTASKRLNYSHLVGKGMLTAVVLGDLTEPPCSRLIQRTIRELCHGTSHTGNLVVSRANSDCFSFGLAVERAKSDCLRVRMLTIDDHDEPSSASIILISKIAGAMADMDYTLDDIYEFITKISQQMLTLPFQPSNQSECKRLRLISSISNINIGDILTLEAVKIAPKTEQCIVLINFFESLETVDQFRFIKRILERFQALEIQVSRLFYGQLMSSQDTIAVTILKFVDIEILKFFDAPCSALGWQKLSQYQPEITTNNIITSVLVKKGIIHRPVQGLKLDDQSCNILETCLRFICDALISCENQLNLFDSESNSGNVGTRLRRACETINQKLVKKKLHTEYPYAMLKSLCGLVENIIGGVMGSIYGILLEGAAQVFAHFEEHTEITSNIWVKALKSATDAFERYYGGECLMFVTIKSCSDILCEDILNGCDIIESFGNAVYAAELAAQRIKSVNCQYPDSGAHAIGICFRALFEGVKLYVGVNKEF